MTNSQEIKNLKDLLENLKDNQTPVFVNLCSRCGNEHFLMDNSISKLQEDYGIKLGYQKLSGPAAEMIKQELMISKNPVLLLINGGQIKSIFGGMVAQYKLEEALENLSQDTL